MIHHCPFLSSEKLGSTFPVVKDSIAIKNSQDCEDGPLVDHTLPIFLSEDSCKANQQQDARYFSLVPLSYLQYLTSLITLPNLVLVQPDSAHADYKYSLPATAHKSTGLPLKSAVTVLQH